MRDYLKEFIDENCPGNPRDSPKLTELLVLKIKKQIIEMDYPKKTELWKALPKKVMYQTFCVIIDYLEHSGKILIDKDDSIVWIWNPELINDFIHKMKEEKEF